MTFDFVCDKLIVPNQFNNRQCAPLTKGYYTIFAYMSMNLIKKQIPAIYVRECIILNWFGDYRSLRFLCGYFGSRIFYFGGCTMKRLLVPLLSVLILTVLAACTTPEPTTAPKGNTAASNATTAVPLHTAMA